MDLPKKQFCSINLIRSWSEFDVLKFLEKNNLSDYRSFCEVHRINGYSLLSLSEGILAMHRPKLDVRKFINAIETLKMEPEKFILDNQKDEKLLTLMNSTFTSTSVNLKQSEVKMDSIYSILENISAQKSFLHCPKLKIREQNSNAYLPMSPYRTKNKFINKFNSKLFKNTIEADKDYYEISENRENLLSRANENLDDWYEDLNFKNINGQDTKRGGILRRIWKHHKIKRQLHQKQHCEDSNTKLKQECKLKCKKSKTIDRSHIPFQVSDVEVKCHKYNRILESSEKVESNPHYYEINLTNNNVNIADTETSDSGMSRKYQADYNSSKLLSSNDLKLDERDGIKSNVFDIADSKCTKGEQYYELLENFHIRPTDIMQIEHSCDFLEQKLASFQIGETAIIVEDYLEPRKCFNSGIDTMETLRREMIQLFDDSIDNKLNPELQTMVLEPDSNIETKTQDDNQLIFMQELKNPSFPKSVSAPVSSHAVQGSESLRPFDKLQRWNDTLRSNVVRKKEVKNGSDMLKRPLPVPIENEFYYMEVERIEAENLLEGQPNGTFILRPSSQSNHAYTLTLTYEGKVYNIGCRKRQDGRLALGFSKVGEPNFLTVHELIDYYYNEKLVILVNGKKVGSTVLKRLHP